MKLFSVFTRIAFVCLCAALVLGVAATDALAISSYSQDFESLDPNSATVLGDDGWLVGANVFDPNGTTFLYNYFAFPAPNGTGAFSNLTANGTAPVGAQGLVVFSDYNNGDHGVGNQIEAIVFREEAIVPSDVGKTATFTFVTTPGDLAAPTTATAFIKTIDPGAGFATTNFVPVDMTSAPSGTYTLTLPIDGSLVGQLFQVGFQSTAANFTPSGRNYDNINVSIPEPGTISLAGLGLCAIAGFRRRK